MKEKVKAEQTPVEYPSLEEMEQEIARLKYKKSYGGALRSTVYSLAVVAAIAILIATLWMPVLQITGASMDPTLVDGQFVVALKNDDFEAGDITAFYYNNKILIKRIIAVPGDYIWIESDGTVFLNGNELDEPYVSEKSLGECDVEFPYQVPENAYFMMGDHRETSIDSRSTVIGCVPQDQIIGKILCKFWPLKEFAWMA